MAYLNIGGDAADASYRYKMPRLVTKVEGRGNGIKTVVVNMTDIAKALHVDPGYPTKFFGIELGAQSKYNKKTERAIVNGCHNAPDLAKILEKFIQVFVLCPTCRLPEIKMDVKKSTVKIDCAACGHNGVLQTVHKLLTYILKDHAEDGKGKKKGKKEKGKKGKKTEQDDEEEGEAAEEVDAEEKMDKKKEEEVEWFTDTSKEAQKARKEKEFSEMQSNDFLKNVDAIIQSSADQSESPAVILKIFMASGTRSITDIQSEMRRLQLSRGLDEPQKIKVLLEAIIDTADVKSVPAQYTKHAELLQKFAPDKTTAMILLNCIEEQVGVSTPKLLPRTPLILQALYDADVIDEDTAIAWYEAPPESSWLVKKDVAMSVREKAVPFMNWLKSAEEESDEED